MRAKESKELEKAAAAITSSILTTLPLMFVEMLRTASALAEEAWEILNHSKFI